MNTLFTPTRAFCLAAAGAALAVTALLLPAVPELAHQHQFADVRAWHGIPHAADVLSNLGFAVAGLWLLAAWLRLPFAARPAWACAPLAGCGLLLTAAGSALYHWHPDAAGLLADRAGMAVAFAGVLGLAAAERCGPRAGPATALAVLVFAAVALLASAHGNVAPWAVLQFGGCAVLLALAATAPARPGVCWSWVVAGYAAAKAFELADHAVMDLTQGWIAGHALKHVAAAVALIPVTVALHNAARPAAPATRS